VAEYTRNVNDQPIEPSPSVDVPSEATTAAEPAAEVVLTADEIKEQMATTRRQIHERSDEVLTSTKELTDWRFHVRRHPWVSVTAAAVIGYAIVPGRTQTTDGDPDDQSDDSKADVLRSMLAATAKRAAMAHLSRTLGDVFGGFFTAGDEAGPATEGTGDE